MNRGCVARSLRRRGFGIAASAVVLVVAIAPGRSQAFALLVDPAAPTVEETMQLAARWAVGFGLEDGIRVGVEPGFASDLGASGGEVALVNQAVLDAFAAWQSSVLRFDVTLEEPGVAEGASSGLEVDLFAVPNSHYAFSDNDFFGRTYTQTLVASRPLTNGQSFAGTVILGADIFINIDQVTALATGFGFTQQEKLDAITRLIAHEAGHALGLGHPNANNPFGPESNFDDDNDPLNAIVIDPADPFANLIVSLSTNDAAVMSNRPCGEPLVSPCPALFFTSLENDDLGGRDVLYPPRLSFTGSGVAATGSFVIGVDTSGGYPAPYTGTISWDDASFDLLGVSTVNLGASLPGGMDLSGSVSPGTGSPPSGIFTSLQQSAPVGPLSIQVSAGDFICPDSTSAGCLGDFNVSMVGLLDSISGTLVGFDPGALPPKLAGVAYAEDAFGLCSTGPGTIVCGGTIALNAAPELPTPEDPLPSTITGSGTYQNSVLGQPIPYEIAITFAAVDQAGDTTIMPLSETEGDLPANFKVKLGSFASTFFDVTTTALVQVPIVVCIGYPDESPPDGIVDGTETAPPGVHECRMRVLHGKAGVFDDETMTSNHASCPSISPSNLCDADPELGAPPCIDRMLNRVCGVVTTGLSPFVAAFAPPPPQIPSLPLPALLSLALLLLAAGAGLSRR